jgi:hypothetical protein
MRFKRAIGALQKLWRVIFLRRRQLGAIKIQAVYRGAQQRQRIQSMQHISVVVQAHARRMLVKNRYEKLVCAIREIQSFARMTVDKRRFRHCVSCAITLQAVIRGDIIRRSVAAAKATAKLHGSIILLQAQTRGVLSRKEFLQSNHSLLTLQSFARMSRDKRRFHRLIIFITSLQAIVRGRIVRRSHFQARAIHFNLRRSRMIRLQAAFRGSLQRKRFKRVVAGFVLFQALFRGSLVRTQLSLTDAKVVMIQSFVRAKIAVRQVRLRFLLRAVVKAQSCSRTFIQHRRYMKAKWVAVSIQKNIRGMMARGFISRQHSCAICIQSISRAFTQRLKFVKLLSGTIALQSKVRGMRQKMVYHCMLDAAVTLQSFLRSVLKKRLYHSLLAGVTIFQARIRGGQSRLLLCGKAAANVAWNDLVIMTENKRILPMTMPFSDSSSAVDFNSAAVLLQSLWRAFRAKIAVAKNLLLSWRMDCYYPSHIKNKMSFLRAGKSRSCLQRRYSDQFLTCSLSSY